MGRSGGGGGDAGGGKLGSNVVFERVVPKFLKGLVGDDVVTSSTRSEKQGRVGLRAGASSAGMEEKEEAVAEDCRVQQELAALRAEGFAVDVEGVKMEVGEEIDVAVGAVQERREDENASAEGKESVGSVLSGRAPKRKHATVVGRVEKQRKGGSLVGVSKGARGFGKGNASVLSFAQGSDESERGDDSDDSS